MRAPLIDVIIPVFNEDRSISQVLRDLPANKIREVIVVNNNSTDRTSEVATRAGATVIHQEKKGYGNACLKGLEYLENKKVAPDIVVFLDGDYSDHPEELPEIIKPLVEQDFELVIGSRTRGEKEPGAMLPQAIFGNWLATKLIFLFYRNKFTDLGPFRALKWESLKRLNMADRNFGWTAEMQVKAAKKKLRCTEVPVNYRKRIGASKVTGTFRGTLMAGYKILWTVFKHTLR